MKLPFAGVMLLCSVSLSAQSSGPTVAASRVADGPAGRLTLQIGWPNAWRNERNHDAAWIVVRSTDARRAPLRLAADGHELLGGNAPVAIHVAGDGVGAFVMPAEEHRGEIWWRLSLRLAEPVPDDAQVWGVGVVHVPAGPFELGDDDPQALRFGAFCAVGQDGEPAGVFRVTDERPIDVGREPGALFYSTDRNRYRGDQAGPIPAAFPKGTRAFYVMKYECRQGDYARWLSALPAAWQQAHAPADLEGEDAATCTIARHGDGYRAARPERPCNYVSWADSAAMFDWLAMRPMTEFEFEKAARGPRRPVAGDYPWGTDSDRELKRLVNDRRDLAHADAVTERALTDANRSEFGASFYWVMDLSGSLWERVVSAGHENGRAFTGSHGDGVLDESGQATNADWPKTVGEDADGLGYRGGAEYFAKRNPDNRTNPHSPVAFRTYAGWGGAKRYKTYSARACRTAPAGEPVVLRRR